MSRTFHLASGLLATVSAVRTSGRVPLQGVVQHQIPPQNRDLSEIIEDNLTLGGSSNAQCRVFLLGLTMLFLAGFSGAFAAAELSPEDVWEKAHANMRQLATLRGESGGFSVRGMSRKTAAYTFLARNNPDGSKEEKEVWYSSKSGQPARTKYRNADGVWEVFKSNFGIKHDYDDLELVEARLAASIASPYSYVFREPTVVGTNECYAVSRKSSNELLDRLNEAMRALIISHASDPARADPDAVERFVPSEKVALVRKADFLIMGYQSRNKYNSIIKDRVCTFIEPNAKLAAAEFRVPPLHFEVAKSERDFRRIIVEADMKYSAEHSAKGGSSSTSGKSRARWVSRMLWLALGAVVVVGATFAIARRRADEN